SRIADQYDPRPALCDSAGRTCCLAQLPSSVAAGDRREIHPAPVHNRYKSSQVRIVDERALDGAARVLQQRVTTRAAGIGEVTVTIDQRRPIHVTAGTRHTNLTFHHYDAVECESAGDVQVTLHEEDSLTLTGGRDVQVARRVKDREVRVTGIRGIGT